MVMSGDSGESRSEMVGNQGLGIEGELGIE